MQEYRQRFGREFTLVGHFFNFGFARLSLAWGKRGIGGERTKGNLNLGHHG
jgi:hypothetical protein